MFGSTSYNNPSRFLKEIPVNMLEGAEEAFESHESSWDKEDRYSEARLEWKYGKNNNYYNTPITTYKVANSDSTSKPNTGFQFRSADSFLQSLNKKANDVTIDLSKYEAGVKVFHKKFGNGIISKVEQEGEDLKVDIDFEKVGHKRLMAKFAGLEIL